MNLRMQTLLWQTVACMLHRWLAADQHTCASALPSGRLQ
jgi:hypothetical protein